jgi:septal ring-binding cell division protein DamX
VINQQPEEQNIQAGSAVRGNQLYSERLAAGARWLVGSGRGKHTVQLMVLASDDSEQNLKEMLGADGFQKIRNQLYIMRRVGSPPTVMLFFGEYGSQADAQQAQNSLPDFLQNLNPYSLSIEDAVKKAKGGE